MRKIKEQLKEKLATITLKKTHCIAAALTLLILLTAAFFILNYPNIPPKGESHAPAQETLPHQPEAITPETESPGTEEENAAPGEGSIIDPIPETETIEPTDDAGSIIVEHNLPNDMSQVPAEQYTTHFMRDEFQCDCTGYCNGFPVEMDPVLLEKLEALRVALGRPVIITSGVRCEMRNAEVGGIVNSRHLSGQAADLYCPGVHYSDVAQVARGLGLWVLEYPEELYIHVEV